MNKLILCEGKTDALLLGYYLGKVAGWERCKNAPKELDIKSDDNRRSVQWYQKKEDYLLICSVGGNTLFKKFFEEEINERLLLVKPTFDKIAIVTDRDNKEIETIEASVNSDLESVGALVKNRKWVNCSYKDAYCKKKSLLVLLLVVPTEHQGALEKVMLDAIAENKYDGNIVDQTRMFAKQMRNDASKYIFKDSLELKAHLRLTWAIKNPENFAKTFDEEIGNFPWENSITLRNCFSKLIKM